MTNLSRQQRSKAYTEVSKTLEEYSLTVSKKVFFKIFEKNQTFLFEALLYGVEDEVISETAVDIVARQTIGELWPRSKDGLSKNQDNETYKRIQKKLVELEEGETND